MASNDTGTGSSRYRPPDDDETLLAQLREAFTGTGETMPADGAPQDADTGEPG